MVYGRYIYSYYGYPWFIHRQTSLFLGTSLCKICNGLRNPVAVSKTQNGMKMISSDFKVFNLPKSDPPLDDTTRWAMGSTSDSWAM